MRSVREIFKANAIFDNEGRHVWGTDRESNHHYGDAYELLIEANFGGEMLGRNTVALMMEVGVADGSSLVAWKEIFPNATVVGMDIHMPAVTINIVKPLEFHIGNQRAKDDCERAAAGREFDLIVDDASHQIPDVLSGLLWLWPFVKPGGLYVIEDIKNDLCGHFTALLPNATIIDTTGPFVGNEPLIALRKPL